MQTQSRSMTTWQLICYGALTTPLAIAGFALVIYIPTFYAVDLGLGLGLVGLVFTFGRVFDVITDPLVGHLSDQTRHRAGARLPWMVLGLPGFLIAVWLLLSPPAHIGLTYLVIVSAAFFLFYTIVDVPYSSIGLEISPHIHERSYLAGSKAAFQVVGAIIASVVPILFASQMNRSLLALAVVILSLSLLSILMFLRFVPRSKSGLIPPRIGLIEAARTTLRHRAYRQLIWVFFIVQSANALTAGLIVLFTTHVIGRPDLIGLFFLVLFASTALFLPLWIWLSKRRSKRFSWAASIGLGCGALGFACLLQTGNVAGMLILCLTLGAVFGADAMMPTSMLADIVAGSEEAGQPGRAATLLALKNAVSKLTFVIPMALAFPVLDLVGLEGASGPAPLAVPALIGFFAALPIALRLWALSLLRRHAVSRAPNATARA